MMSYQMTGADWDELESLSRLSGLPLERVTSARSAASGSKPGSRVTLIAGRPGCGVEGLVDVLCSADARSKLEANDILVIGASDDPLVAMLGAVATASSSHLGKSPAIVLRTSGLLSAEVRMRLGPLGLCAQGVLVTPANQALHEKERELVRELSERCATGRVVYVVPHGMETTAGELKELREYASAVMRSHGFAGSRFLGAAFMRSGSLKSVPGDDAKNGPPVLDVSGVDVQRGAAMIAAGQLRAVVKAGIKAASSLPLEPPVDLADEGRLREELRTILDRSIDRIVVNVGARLSAGPDLSDADVQRCAADVLAEWTAGSTREGIWLKYLTGLRPGASVRFEQSVTEFASTLSAVPSATPASSPPGPSTLAPAKIVGWSPVLVRFGIAVAVGLIVALVSGLVLNQFFATAAGMAVAIAGYATLPSLGVLPNRTVAARAGHSRAVTKVDQSIAGTAEFRRAISAWFEGTIANTPPIERWRGLSKRLELNLDAEEVGG